MCRRASGDVVMGNIERGDRCICRDSNVYVAPGGHLRSCPRHLLNQPSDEERRLRDQLAGAVDALCYIAMRPHADGTHPAQKARDALAAMGVDPIKPGAVVGPESPKPGRVLASYSVTEFLPEHHDARRYIERLQGALDEIGATVDDERLTDEQRVKLIRVTLLTI
jgi:hypothetical protein